MNSLHTRRWWSLAAVTLGTFIAMLDVTVVNVALPSIQRSLDASVSELEWVVNAYGLSLAVLMLTGGKLADMLGRRRLFALGLTAFAVGSLGAGLSTSPTMLLAARAVQGGSAALATPAALSIIVAVFPPAQRGLAFGINGAVAGLATAVGPIIGGLLTESVGWRWIFFVNLPVVALALAVARCCVDESRDTSSDQRLDLLGLLTAAVGLFGVTFGVVEANRDGWTSVTILSMFGLAAVGLLVFAVVEARQRRPMLAPSLFRMGVFSRANVIAVLLSFAMFGLFFFVSLYLQNVRGYSPIQAGAAFLPMTVTMMLVAPVAGVGIARGGARWLTVTGLLLLAVSLSMFAGLDVHSSFLAICTPMTLAGAAIALALTPLLDLALGSVPADTLGVAAGVFNSARQVGGALGLAVMGAIVSSGVTSSAALGATAAQSFVRGFHHAVLCSAAVALCGAVVAFRIRPPATSPVASDPPVAELLRSTPLTHDGERSPLRQLATEAMDD